MSLVINTNSAATAANVNLARSTAMLQKSLSRLSSGIKITSPADDAGGLAVSMKMSAAIKRTDAVNTGVANAISLLQTQDGALKTVGKIMDRISELKSLYNDPTKNAADKANYDTEFTALKTQLASLATEKFNGVSLFGGTTLSVTSTEDGTGSVTINQSNVTGGTNYSVVTGAVNLGVAAMSVAAISGAIQEIATLRAANGAQTSQLQFASEMLSINKTNLEAANSRIIDTDVAAESTRFARFSILVQAGAAMLAQANASPQVALRLIG